MPKIFVLNSIARGRFDKYKALIKDLAQGTLKPGAKPEPLQGKIDGQTLYSLRLNDSDRLLYMMVESGPDQGAFILCAAADGHQYQRHLNRLSSHQGALVVDSYVDEEEGLIGAVAEALSASDSQHEALYCHNNRFIEFDFDQKKALKTRLPAVFHGTPGTGKTLVAGKMLHQYVAKPLLDENGVPLGFLYLAPTQELVAEARRNYDEVCSLVAMDDGQVRPKFATYAEFFQESMSAHEGWQLVGFDDFNHWYKQSKVNKAQRKEAAHSFSAEDCWAAFRITSLYPDVADLAAYLVPSDPQCAVPRALRAAIHQVYRQYSAHCGASKKCSAWLTPFKSTETFGLVLTDELQTQSGAMVLSLYAAARDGQFAAVVGGHQKTDAHDSGYGRGLAAVDLLGLSLHHKSPFQTHHLTQTHRNSQAVIEVINWIIEQKNRIGLKTLLKGADGHLQGGMALKGDADFIFTTESPAALFSLQQRFLGQAQLVVITAADWLAEARALWVGAIVLTPAQALGLEYQNVICYRLLESSNDKQLGEALASGSKSATAAGHRGKVQPSNEIAALESWFNELIIACTRAKTGVHFVELRSLHNTRALTTGLQQLCSTLQAREQPAAAAVACTESLASPSPAVSTEEEWLEQACLLLEKGPEMRAEALRIMDVNVPKGSDVYRQFLVRYADGSSDSNQQVASAAVVASAHSPALLTAAAAPLIIPSAAVPAMGISKPAKKAIPAPAVAAVAKKIPRSPEQHALAVFACFNDENLTNALLDCDAATLLFLPIAGKDKACLADLLAVEDHRKTFARCCINNNALIAKIEFQKIKTKITKNTDKAIKNSRPAISGMLDHLDQIRHFFQTEQLSLLIRMNEPVTLSAVAAFANRGDIIGLLSQCGADVGSADLAHIAAGEGHDKLFRTLKMLGVDLNKANNKGHTPAHIATKRGRIEVLRALKALGADLNLADEKGLTPAYIATQHGRIDVLCELKKLGADLNQANKAGATCAHVAAFMNKPEVLRVLKKQGADLDLAQNNGERPASFAVTNGFIEVLRVLKELGVDLNKERDGSGTLACLAAFLGQSQVIRVLKELGVDLNQAQQDGETPVFFAVYKDHVDVLDVLHELGANLNLARNDGATPALIAAQHGNIASLRRLHKHGIDLSQANGVGDTCAFVAAFAGKCEALCVLKELLVDLNSAKPDGTTPVFIAAQGGHSLTLAFLLQQGCDSTSVCTFTANAWMFNATGAAVATQGRLCLKIKERMAQGCCHERISLSPLDIAEVMGHQEVVVLLRAAATAAAAHPQATALARHGTFAAGAINDSIAHSAAHPALN
ncbi:MAG: ankyrin repeat domain-containing protein [Legionellales bacterium]